MKNRRPQLKTAPAVVFREREEAPPDEITGGEKTGRLARYSPSPQPSDLRDPQAGFAGARPSGKAEKWKGKRY